MTHQTLKQRADEILELDKKRTKGEWANYSTGDIWAEDINDSVYTECGSRNAIKNEDRNFIAAAPRMAQLIREQQCRIEELEDIMELLPKEPVMQDEKLKPCPFCGNDKFLTEDDAPQAYITCRKCGMCFNRCQRDDEWHLCTEDPFGHMVKAWNTRADEPKGIIPDPTSVIALTINRLREELEAKDKRIAELEKEVERWQEKVPLDVRGAINVAIKEFNETTEPDNAG